MGFYAGVGGLPGGARFTWRSGIYLEEAGFTWKKIYLDSRIYPERKHGEAGFGVQLIHWHYNFGLHVALASYYRHLAQKVSFDLTISTTKHQLQEQF